MALANRAVRLTHEPVRNLLKDGWLASLTMKEWKR